MSTQLDPYDTNAHARVGSVLYYSITAAIVVALAITVVAAKWYYQRKQRLIQQRLIDVEREAQMRRGEAEGLPTYGEREQAGTSRIPVATLAYPESAYRGIGQEWAHISPVDGTSHPGAQHDLALPMYDTPAEPPKYEFNTEESAQHAGQGAVNDAGRNTLSEAISGSRTATPAPSVRDLTTGNIPGHHEMSETSGRRHPVSYAAPQLAQTAPSQLPETMVDVPSREERST